MKTTWKGKTKALKKKKKMILALKKIKRFQLKSNDFN